MVDQLQLIERLEGVRRIIHNNTDLADVVLLGMIEEAEQKVAQFEKDAEETFALMQEEFVFSGS